MFEITYLPLPWTGPLSATSQAKAGLAEEVTVIAHAEVFRENMI